MNRYTWIWFVCVLACYKLAPFLMNKDTSATATYCLIGFALAKFLTSVIRHFSPLEFIPDLDKKAVFITGCDSGFGHKLALRMDGLGLMVYACCLFPEGSGAKELKDKSSSRLHILKLDVTEKTDIAKALEYVKSTLGDRVLCGIVNNAGISTCCEVEWHSEEAVENVMDINFLGPVRIIKAFIPLLRKSKGRIVNVASVAAYAGVPWIAPYCASKSALKSFSDALREELRKFSISVHTIEPHFYMTAILFTLDTSVSIWNACPKEVKDEYKPEYYETVKERLRSVLYNFAKPSRRLSEVVNSMLDACIGINPQDSCTPGLSGRISRWIMMHCSSVVMLCMRLIMNTSIPFPVGSKSVGKKEA